MSTNIYLVVDLPSAKVEDFLKAMQLEFYIDSDAVMQEVRRSTSDSIIFIAGPEDLILQKLVWYKMGSQISERQRMDVLG